MVIVRSLHLMVTELSCNLQTVRYKEGQILCAANGMVANILLQKLIKQ
jgi:hypothetical protein